LIILRSISKTRNLNLNEPMAGENWSQMLYRLFLMCRILLLL